MTSHLNQVGIGNGCGDTNNIIHVIIITKWVRHRENKNIGFGRLPQVNGLMM